MCRNVMNMAKVGIKQDVMKRQCSSGRSWTLNVYSPGDTGYDSNARFYNDNMIYIQGKNGGIGPDDFDPVTNKLENCYWVYDIRYPLISHYNAYAPSIVKNGDQVYNIYFGGQLEKPAGSENPHDEIYIQDTPDDFISFNAPVKQIHYTGGEHANNPNVIKFQSTDGTNTSIKWYMVFTFLKILQSPFINRPFVSRSTDGASDWTPNYAETGLTIDDNSEFINGNIDGGCGLYYDSSNNKYNYFYTVMDSTNPWPGNIYLATGTDGTYYDYAGIVLDKDITPGKTGGFFVNDVKKINNQFIMLTHYPVDTSVYYNILDTDGDYPKTSLAPTKLFSSIPGATQGYYISTCTMVVDGEYNDENKKLRGVVYGAGSNKLDDNKLYAAWLQKKVLFQTKDGSQVWGYNKVYPWLATRSYGPDNAYIMTPTIDEEGVQGNFLIFGEGTEPDETLSNYLWKSDDCTVHSKSIIELSENN